jgi:predicted porin
MNKTLIASAMGLVMAGSMGLANADVKLYGQIDLSLLYRDSDAPGFEDDINMKSQNSSLGIKGSEDLGNGLSAFFKLEYESDVAQGGDFGTGRDQYVGFKMERFGKMTFGTTSTAYKSPGSKIDPFYRTPLQSRSVGLQSNLHSGKGEEGQGRGTNMARYDSPKFFGGFGLTATYQFDSNKQGGVEDDDPYSIGVTYKAGNLYAAASYIDTQNSDASDTAAAQILAKYTWNNFAFRGIYEMDDGLITAQRSNGIGGGTGGRAGAADDDGADVWSVGVDYTIGNNLIAADYGSSDESDGKDGIAGTADDVQEYDVWRVGGYHKFSKRTRVYAIYANTDYDDKGEDDQFALGVRHNF